MGERIPNVATSGVLIGQFDAQPAVRKNAENALDWKYKEEAAYLYRLAVIFRDRLVDPVLRIDRNQVPDPVISFDDMRNNNILAAYTLARNPQGLLHEITLNTAHYVEVDGKEEWKFGKWAQAESLLHEMLHLKQQKYGRDPYKRGKSTHNKEFCTMAKQLGLNVVPNVGCHFAVADEGSPFAILMHEMGIERPTDIPRAEGVRGRRFDWFEIGKKERGRSSLTKWSCGCQNVRIGTKEFHARCTNPDCGNEFTRVDLNNEIAPLVFDIDDEIHRRELEQDPFPLNDYEDLGSYIDRGYEPY